MLQRSLGFMVQLRLWICMFPPKFIFLTHVFSKQLSVQIVVKMQTRNRIRKIHLAWTKKRLLFFFNFFFSWCYFQIMHSLCVVSSSIAFNFCKLNKQTLTKLSLDCSGEEQNRVLFLSVSGTGLAAGSPFPARSSLLLEGQIAAGASRRLGEAAPDWQPSVIHLWHRVCFWWQGW